MGVLCNYAIKQNDVQLLINSNMCQLTYQYVLDDFPPQYLDLPA